MINLPPYPKDTEPQWEGLTLEQMQMRRTLVQARMEIQKFKLAAQIDSCKQKSSFLGGEKSIFQELPALSLLPSTLFWYCVSSEQ